MSDITDETISGAENDQLVNGDLFVRGVVKSKKGCQTGYTQVTATADGLTTGLIPEGTGFASITAANAAHIITLPSIEDDMIGCIIRGFVGANGCKLRTPASSNQKINNVDSDGTATATIAANSMIALYCIGANDWLLTAWSNLGAVLTAIVPA